jgi:6,7-dimethyl-8-ribityllumazine synthase
VSSGGFWPGDRPARQDPEEAAEPEEAVEAPKPFSENGGEPAAEAEPVPGDEEDTGDQEAVAEPGAEPALRVAAHAPGELRIPDDVSVLEGTPSGPGRAVGVVVARFNGEVTNLLLESALAELDRAGIPREHVTVVPVPGAFELPLAAMGLAKTRRYACIVALGCVIRGETAHFEYVAGEAASGLQLAALETGVPVAFGVLTVDTLEQATARADKGAEAASSALEMADLFSQLRQQRA